MKFSLTESSFPLEQLYLDPNNPRLAINDLVDEAKLADTSIQKKTLRLITSKNNTNISDLIASFKQHSYIPAERIIVRPLNDNSAIVIEGNRRLATLKFLYEKYEDGEDIGNFDPDIFAAVPVITHKGDDKAIRKVIMGLKHISGSKKWSAMNQAKFIENLMVNDSLSEEEICSTYTISKVELRTILRTLSLIALYKDSDYGDNFSNDKYSTFREIVKSPRIKEWLEIPSSATDFKFANESRLDRLFSLISPQEIEDLDLDDDDDYLVQTKEAIIETALQIRELAKIIDDEKALANLEATRNLMQATLSSEVLGKNKLENALTVINEQINISFGYSFLIDDKKSDVIQNCIKKLNALLVTRNNESDDSNVSNPFHKKPIVESCQQHFEEISIDNYKRFTQLKLYNLSKVNIFAGINNAGKSSLLEALYLLTKLGDTQSVLSINKYRRKHNGEQKTINVFSNLPATINVSAIYNKNEIQLNTVKETEIKLENQSGFIGRLSSVCSYLGRHYDFYSDFYSKKNTHYASSNNTLCNSVISFSSGFDDEQVFRECYQKAVTNGAKFKVIEFIKRNIDSDILDVELSDVDGTFIVIYEDTSRNMDLSQYGDGLQKIFHLGIKFAACSNGVLLLDEVENGIHKDLLVNFTKLIQELSEAYNVQVFVTSHSKECIDSFISNGFHNEKISAYAIDANNNEVEYFSGDDLEGLINYINVDIRGEK